MLVLPSPDEGIIGFHYAFNVRDVVEATSRRSFRVAICLDPEDRLTFDYLCRLAYIRGDLTFAVDELHEFCPNQHGAIPRYFKKLCLHGRHRAVGIVGVSQRPANIHKDFFSQAARVHVFRLLFGDLDALRRMVPNIDRACRFKRGEFLTFPNDEETKNPVRQSDR